MGEITSRMACEIIIITTNDNNICIVVIRIAVAVVVVVSSRLVRIARISSSRTGSIIDHGKIVIATTSATSAAGYTTGCGWNYWFNFQSTMAITRRTWSCSFCTTSALTTNGGYIGGFVGSRGFGYLSSLCCCCCADAEYRVQFNTVYMAYA